MNMYYALITKFEQQGPSEFFQLQDSATSLMGRKPKYDSWPRMLTW